MASMAKPGRKPNVQEINQLAMGIEHLKSASHSEIVLIPAVKHRLKPSASAAGVEDKEDEDSSVASNWPRSVYSPCTGISINRLAELPSLAISINS